MKAAEKLMYLAPWCESLQLQPEGVIAASSLNLDDPPSLPTLGE